MAMNSPVAAEDESSGIVRVMIQYVLNFYLNTAASEAINNLR